MNMSEKIASDTTSGATTLTACPCCGGRLSKPFYNVGPVPVHSCLMLDTPEAASAFSQASVTLAQCEDCAFVTNIEFDRKWSAYAPEYEDQQSFSPTFNSFAGQLARHLVEAYGLEGKQAVEVGCSKGDFLALLCEAGNMETVGIDPSVVEGRVKAPSRGSMRLIQEYYGPQHLDLPADLLCCRHTLEHIQNVHETLVMMYAQASKTPGSVLCIEVPCATRLWKDCAFEDIYYEHCSYFTPGSLAAAVRRAGFGVIDLRREYDDQYIVIEAVTDPARDTKSPLEDSVEDERAMVEAFVPRVAATKAAWRDHLTAAKDRGEKIAVWGSGSKCVAFLRTLKVQHLIDAIVDINPHRDGKTAPGLSMPISQPKALADLKPDTLVIMNPIYEDEIINDCTKMGIKPKTLKLGQTPE